MSIENGSREDAHYQEIANDIKEKGYYSLPAGSVIDVKIITGASTEIPITDINIIPTGNTMESHNDIDTK